MWIALILSYVLPINNLGIMPRSTRGLFGILFAPFLHGGFSHLLGNSIALFLLGSLLLGIEGKGAISIVIFLTLLSGGGTWLIGSANSVHIGASGLIYGLMSYLLFFGIFKRSVGSIAVSIIVFLLYGGAIWGVLPTNAYISWEMHLCGFLAGVVIAKMNIRRDV